MIRALAFALIASQASAQAPCMGLADTAALLAQNHFVAVQGGLVEGGTVTIYTEPGGRWVAVEVHGELACIARYGNGWGPVGDPA